MIKIKRTAEPSVLAKNKKKWVKKIKVALDSNNKKALKLATNKYTHEDIKQELNSIFHERCAYCEINTVGDGEIDHFRPTSKFPLLAVKWSNLFLSCGRCNGTNVKGDNFPTPKFVNPCIDNPDEHFNFEYDEVIGIAIVSGKTERGIKTEETLHLNDEALKNHRSSYIKKLFVLAKVYSDNHPRAGEIKALLEQSLDESNPNAQYLAFAKTIKQKMINPIN